MIKSDSRRICRGDIFVALPGVKSDGHDYVNDAINRGASSVVVTHGEYSVNTIIVDNTRNFLENYVVNNYKSIIDDMIIIGVTGTNGKTTTCYLLYQALNKLGIKCSMIGTLGYFKESKVGNLYNTCPDLAMNYELLIDSYNSGFKCVVLEASSQGLAEDRLYGVSFDYTIFTNLTLDHLDYHKDFYNYVMSKQKLFKMLKSDGIGIVNVDDKYSSYFSCKNLVTYGFFECDYRIISYGDFNFKFLYDSVYEVRNNLIGKFNVYNLMCCIIVLHRMGIPIDKILSVISSINAPSGRMEIYRYLNNYIIVDYAHTPDAIKQVLCSIKGYNKLYAVFGCTGERDRSKRPIMTQLLVSSCDYVFITSDDLYDESFSSIVADMLNGVNGNNYTICPDRGDAITRAISMLNENDILLVLGKGHEEYIKVGGNLIPFNDGKFILNIIGKSV